LSDSRVIKSLSVNLQPPRIVEHTGIVELLQHKAALDLPLQVSEQEVADLKEQAGQILAETEEMVKDLLETARVEAEKIIRSANEEARRIVEEGRERLKQEEEEAFNKGWKTGYAEGAGKAEEEFSRKIRDAEELVNTAVEERERIVAGSEQEIIKLAIAVAEKIIGRELETGRETIADMVKRAVAKAADREELTVRVNPDNMDSVINAKEDIVRSIKGVGKIKVLADPAVSPGGCVVEGSSGMVDARIESQVAEIEQALAEVNPNA